jgi:hypothetical protein
MNQSTFTARHLVAADQRQTHIEQLEDQITELAAHISAATYRQVKRNEALDQENVPAGTFFHCAPRWRGSNYGRPIAINGRSGH